MNLTSNEPFWLVKNGILNSYPSLKENIETDILVIGAGITGSLTAHQCIKDGYKTVIVDKREIANGSTSASTCMLQYEIDIPLYELSKKIGKAGAVASYKACSDSIDKLDDLVKQINSDCGFKKKQSLYSATSKKDLKWMKSEFEIRKENGFDVSWLSGEEIKEKFGLEGSYGGILSEQGASFDSFHFTHDLLKHNFEKGLEIYDKTFLKSKKSNKDNIVFETENGDTITAKKVIYCTGFETTEIIKEKFVSLLNTYAIAGERSNQNSILTDILIWDSSEPYHYMRTTDDLRLLVGGEDEKFSTPDKKLSLVGKKTKLLSKHVNKVFPQLDFTPDFSWCGTFGETKDGLPYIGTHPKFPESYFVLGFGGNGITFSVTGMGMVSSWLQNKPHSLSQYFKFGR